jgi:hypothetical protein
VPGFDLKSYLARFPEVCRKKFGRAFSFATIEKEFEPLRTGGRTLKARDVLRLFDANQTPFRRYWPKPDGKDLDRALREAPLHTAPIPDDGRMLVTRLLGVLHSMGIVSLVLRFVHPARFGIFSTPIANLLQIHRSNTVDLYLAFCRELQVWQERFGMDTVAQTEMALWTYDQLATGRAGLGENHEARASFEHDLWTQRRRVGQALTPLLENYGSLELASILAVEHPKLAGMIAGAEFERRVRLKAKKFYGRRKLERKTEVRALINEFAGHGQIGWPDRDELHDVWDVRDKAVHPGRLSSEEVENMIDTIERVCRAWDS